jgi:pimeloyl-ACP methyl ester carboxylesterase
LSSRGSAWGAGVAGSHAGRYGPGPSVDQLGRDLAAILDRLVPDGPVVLAGHSMGGMTIMALADQRPELFGGKVAGVLLTNTSGGGLDRLTLGFPEFVARPVRGSLVKTMRRIAAKPGKADAVRARQATDTKLAVVQTRWLLFGRRAPRAVVVECNEIIKACPSATLAGFLPALLTHEKHAALKALGAAEVEIVAAARDKLTPAGHARKLADGIPGARLTVVPGTGHMLPMERPQAVTEPLIRLAAAAAAARVRNTRTGAGTDAGDAA